MIVPLPSTTERAAYNPAVTRPDTILGFNGEWHFLSNFHRSVLDWEGLRFNTAEAAFNAGKTLDMAARQRIAAAVTPGEAKRLGRRVVLRPGWDQTVRYQVMDAVLHAKFTAHPARTTALLSTGDRLLVESNSWHDNHWGDCVCGRPACAAPGENHLGRALMRLRAQLAVTLAG